MFTIPDIEYSLNATGSTCSQMQYLCVEFAKGDNPQVEKPQLPFQVAVVRSEDDARYVAETSKRGCTQFLTCKGSSYFSYTSRTLRACFNQTDLTILKICNRGFSCEIISIQFCKSSYSRPPCWFPFAWTGIGKYN